MISNLIINGIYITLHYVDIQLNICSFWFCSLLFLYFEGKEKFSALRQGNGDSCQLVQEGPLQPLLCHGHGSSQRDLDAEGTHDPICPCLPILWMRNLRSKKGSDLLKIRVLGVPELFFLNTSLRVSSHSWGEWLHEWLRSSMPEKARTVPLCASCVHLWVSESVPAVWTASRGVSMKYTQVFLPVVKT